MLLFASCTTAEFEAQIGYSRLSVGGDLSLSTGSNSAATQDVGSVFGLGSGQDSPYVRVAADLGLLELRASGFWFREEGSGVLSQPFGGLPSGASVTSELELGNAKLVAALAAQLGPVTIAPGFTFDAFAIDFRASGSPGNREEVDELVALPMPYLRLSVPVFGVVAAAELAYLDPPDFIGADGRFADMEAVLELPASSRLHLVAGYRYLSADAEGNTATETVGIDLRVDGWFFGGGLRF